MKRSVVDIHPEAILEGRDARDWYFSKSAQAEEAFRMELERAIRLIREAPETWPRYLTELGGLSSLHSPIAWSTQQTEATHW
jgi:hypothetical protein